MRSSGAGCSSGCGSFPPEGAWRRGQRTFNEDPEVQQLVLNRLRFHAFQITQQDNAQTGKLGVETLEDQAAA